MKNLKNKKFIRILKGYSILKKKITFLSYKNFTILKKFINSNYKIKSFIENNLKKFCQNKIKKYIKYSKYLGLLPYILKPEF